ncbi:serine hydrolase domain-containing protein [Aestuariimicrobium ganziense]|uniref:serine hydrolase domain-containing protein n=1 Tax=Aestuariimicrobium ganziense TaxID=2773677 RepID=UPI001944816F|nr:serine hydrolase domain-containing protein [Aestuariimicrobium ganziense]
MDEVITRIRTALDRLVDEGTIPAWSAAVEIDAQVATAAGGAADERTIFPVASLSKAVAAVLALQLVDSGELGLDDPISRWLPEFAEPMVLRERGSALDDVVAATRPITVRHLLTMTSGVGLPSGGSSVMQAMAEQGLMPPDVDASLDADRFVERLATLPLNHQPGEGWCYHHSTDLLTVLLTRLTGNGIGDLVQQRVADPLGLTSWGFWAPAARLAVSHHVDEGRLEPDEPLRGASPPAFPSLSSGLVSTARDQLTFWAALGRDDARLGDPSLLRELRSNQLTADQVASAGYFLDDGDGWGFQVAVATGDRPGRWRAGRFGWSGGTGGQAASDPGTGITGVVLTARAMDDASSHPAFEPFWDAVHGDSQSAGQASPLPTT